MLTSSVLHSLKLFVCVASPCRSFGFFSSLSPPSFLISITRLTYFATCNMTNLKQFSMSLRRPGRKAVTLARQFYFNYTTPDRRRQDMLGTMTPLPTDHCPFTSKGDGKGAWVHSPVTPQAPKHGLKPPSRLKFIEMEQIAAVLFQESAFPSRHLVPSVIPKPLCKPLGSNRVLFYDDELCQGCFSE